MNPALLQILARLAAGGAAVGGAALPIMLSEGGEDEAQHGSREDYLADESVPIEERMANVEGRAASDYEKSPAHQARLAALLRLKNGKKE